tara:strand:- start:835 stop:1242 length:408 start_codon:yes stop_codon:yes gene_type:complete
MATFQLADVKGGGGVYVPEVWVTNQTLAAGVTGDILTIGTAGKITVLEYLTTDSSSQSGMGLVVDGNVVKENEILGGTTPSSSSHWGIYTGGSSTNVSTYVGRRTSVSGEFITLTKTGAITTQALLYSYTTGSKR